MSQNRVIESRSVNTACRDQTGGRTKKKRVASTFHFERINIHVLNTCDIISCDLCMCDISAFEKNDQVFLFFLFQPFFVKKLSQKLEQPVKWFTDYTIMMINGFIFYNQMTEIKYRGKKKS